MASKSSDNVFTQSPWIVRPALENCGLKVMQEGKPLFGCNASMGDIKLEHPSISPRHALIGHGSSHGTFVNSTRLKKRKREALRDGDTVKFSASTREHKKKTVPKHPDCNEYMDDAAIRKRQERANKTIPDIDAPNIFSDDYDERDYVKTVKIWWHQQQFTKLVMKNCEGRAAVKYEIPDYNKVMENACLANKIYQGSKLEGKQIPARYSWIDDFLISNDIEAGRSKFYMKYPDVTLWNIFVFGYVRNYFAENSIENIQSSACPKEVTLLIIVYSAPYSADEVKREMEQRENRILQRIK